MLFLTTDTEDLLATLACERRPLISAYYRTKIYDKTS